MPSHPMPSHPMPSHPMPSHPMPSHPMPSHPMPSPPHAFPTPCLPTPCLPTPCLPTPCLPTPCLPTPCLPTPFSPFHMGAFEECFGPNRVVSFTAYNESVKGRVRVGRFICHVHVYQTESACDDLQRRYTTTLRINFAKREIARRRTPGPWFKYPAGDFLRKFNSDHHVIAFGNMFGVGGRELRFQGAAPLVVRPECRGLLQPSPAIQQAAVGFVNTYLGPSYAAVHLRRGDFFQHCIHGNGRLRPTPCYQPLAQVAACLHQRLQRLPGVRMVFLASNADATERRVLRETLTALGSPHALVSLPVSLVGEAWAEPLERGGVAGRSEVVSFLDKAVCALALQFYGTAGSTFSSDIMRLREWWKQGLCETYICPANQPADFLRLPERGNASAPAPSPAAGDSAVPSLLPSAVGAAGVSPTQPQGQKPGKMVGEQGGLGGGGGGGGAAAAAAGVDEGKGNGKRMEQRRGGLGRGGHGGGGDGKREGSKVMGTSGKEGARANVAPRVEGTRKGSGGKTSQDRAKG
ncbi:hypothetical protein CLOM_g14114 [Closterium sp. NIES-68]|nr:hypothetical protein CLOM_g14114 [Closterium sp. NIES-68]